MRLFRLLSALFLALALMPAAARAEEPRPIRLSYVFSDGNIPGTLAAYRKLIEARPDLKGRIELQFLAESTFDETDPARIAASDVLVYDVMNEQLLRRFDSEKKTDLIATVKARGTVLGVGQGLQGPDAYRQQGIQWDEQARAYWEHGGPQNQRALMELALTKAGVTGFTLPAPQPSLDFGYYYPDGENGRVFADWDAFQTWRAANGKLKPGAPRIAIGFFKATYYTGDTRLLNALVAEVEKQGAEAVPVFGYPGAVAFHKLIGTGKDARADAGLGLFFQFNDTQSSKLLEQVGIPVINLITLYGRSEQEWRSSPQGLSAFEGTFNLAGPELAGTVAPTVVGTKEKIADPLTGLNSVITSPIPSRVSMAVSRALRYAELARKPNGEKRIAILYYNFPPGKAGIAASYLNVAESIATILKRMKAEGYDVGDRLPSPDEVLAEITTKARNVGGDAPGELEEMLALGQAERVSVTDYRRWLDALAPPLRDKIVKDWGQPEDNRLMTERKDGQTYYVIPLVRYGKVILTPQPSRAWGEDLEKLYHAKDLAPHHQYVAGYAWLRNGFKADAVVHVGTHGTLEWLDGRDAGLGEEDAPDALIADLPDAYIYNVDVVGEGLVARRRGMATLIDHMVPPFVAGGLTEDLAKLGELIDDHSQNETKNPELAAAYAKQAREAAGRMGIAKDLGLDPAKPWTDEQLHQVEDYLLELKGQTIPYGLHAFGRVPEPDAVTSTVDAIVSVDRSGLPDRREVLAQEMRQRILLSGPRELDGLMTALGGRFVPAGMGGEPIRNPDAYPTGANFYGIDPDKIPKPAAWDMGTRMAEQMLQDFKRRHGRYPAKVSFVIWGDETMRHEGVLESQIFYLLGTKPVWDERGKVTGVEVVPREQLGRPRVDIVIASASEGLFGNLTRLMDEAVQKVKALDEADNQVRQHYLATRSALIAKGVDAKEADKMAGVRIFDEPPGNYNLNTSAIIGKSGSWDDEAGFANDYIRKMGHGFGNGYWGQPMPDVFRMALSGTDTVVHSNSTALYGALDNDDMFMYMGGLAAAVRNVDGTTPETMVADSRDPGRPAMRSLDEFIGREFRSRYVNPTWIRGMQKEGYAGAGAMREFIEYLWGWDATVTDAVDDAMWQHTYETYVEDRQKLGMKQFFESKSPFAYQDITARMIETIRKDYWKADAKTRGRLVREYLDSVAAHGVNCTDVSCGNGRLLRYVMEQAASQGVPAPLIAKARAAMEKAMGRSIESAAAELEAFARRNDAREKAERDGGRKVAAAPAARQGGAAQAGSAQAPSRARVRAERTPPPSPAPPRTGQDRKAPEALKGQVMREEDRSSKTPPAPRALPPALAPVDVIWPAILFALLLGGWRWRERARPSEPA
ncbi:cobaltochelatase subunit CobN [Sphingobium cloacae]|uniref:Putative cobaltochelatase n=1 Tax=Sphingobium cloacae TaxID=120107 RepID=A0A1E1F5W4_9SPHN|nr:cobaltochelatase subunit CobN [Sphingobium cloacae]BAV65916.1 putative cobaltochelatase [Sphingobium cloacae]